VELGWIFNQCRYGGGVMDSRDNVVASDMGCIAVRVALNQGFGEIQSRGNLYTFTGCPKVMYRMSQRHINI
jgi:hypothetical protein